MKPAGKEVGDIGLEDLSFALSFPLRWRILELLLDGRAWAVIDLGRKLGVKRSTVSKHVILLGKAGLVVQGPGRLYELAPGLKPAEGSRDLRLGLCTLHFG